MFIKKIILPFILTLSVFFCFSFVCAKENSSKKYDLVVCALFQNEDFFLKEWLEFHKLQGVQHFYLYNNLSTDSYSEILKPYIEKGEVTLIDWPIETRSQMEYIQLLQLPVYNHALEIVRETARWAAFIDLDEFLFSVEDGDLVQLLDDYEEYAALAVNWQMYGTSWVDFLPEQGLITENLIWKAPTNYEVNHIVKLIVQPHLVERITNPHRFIYKDNYYAVNSEKAIFKDEINENSILTNKVRINHYWFGPYNWFITNKMPRRSKWGVPTYEKRLNEMIALFNQTKDEVILKFVPQLKEKMQASN